MARHINRAATVYGAYGIKDTVRGFGEMLTAGGRLHAKESGAFLENIQRLLITPHELHPGAKALERASFITGNVASRVVKATGISYMDAYMRGVAFYAAKFHLESPPRCGDGGESKSDHSPSLLRARCGEAG